MDAKLSLTTACGAKCATCPAWKRPASMMSVDDFCHIWMKLNDSPFVDRILINGTGDITVHPEHEEFFEAMEVYKRKPVIMTTNGAYLKKVPKVLDELIISFNGGTPEGYKRTTGLDFHKVSENIRSLYPFHGVWVEMHCLIWQDNEGEEEAFAEHWKDFPGRKRISYKAENQGGEYFGVMEDNERIPCDYLSTLCVEWDGRVSACNHDWEGVSDFGNLLSDSVRDVLFNDKRIAMIEAHKRGEFTGICESCNYNVRVDGKIRYV